MTLIAPGRLILWGNGCECAPRTTFEITPTADGWWIEIEVSGVQIFDRTATDNRVAGVLALEAPQAAETLRELLAEHRAQRASTDRDFAVTGVGTLTMTLPLATGVVEVFVTDANRLMAVGDVLLDLVRHANLPVDDRLHPVPRDLR